MKTPNLTLPLIIVAVILFFVGRFTAPETIVEDKHKIDSLTRDLNSALRREAVAIDSTNHYKVQSNTWFNEFTKAEKNKSVTHTIYDNRKKTIDALLDADLDSAFRAVYPDK